MENLTLKCRRLFEESMVYKETWSLSAGYTIETDIFCKPKKIKGFIKASDSTITMIEAPDMSTYRLRAKDFYNELYLSLKHDKSMNRMFTLSH